MKAKEQPLHLKILNGPLKNSQWVIKKGLILSRSKGKNHILIKDHSASNPHAKIVKKKNIFYLEDLDSKNGTMVEGEINDYFPLKPGLVFKIGKVRFQVLEIVKPKKPVVKPHWSVMLAKELKAQESKIRDQSQTITAFNPLLTLLFKSGVQKSDSWLIGYGPRHAGHACIDLPILDPSAPNMCFSLHPHPVPNSQNIAVLFKTPYPEKVRINSQHLSKKILEKGDIISVADTSILVDFDKL